MPIIGIWKCPNCNVEREATPAEIQGSIFVTCKQCKNEHGVGILMSQRAAVIQCDVCGRREMKHCPFWYRFTMGVTMADLSDFPPGATGTMFFCTRFCMKKWILANLEKFFTWAVSRNFSIESSLPFSAAFKVEKIPKNIA